MTNPFPAAASTLRALFAGLLEAACPTLCFGCGTRLGWPARPALCRKCRAGIPDLGANRCLRCAAPVGPHLGEVEDCPDCRGRSLSFSGAAAAGRYEGLLRELVLGLKNGGDWAASFVLADLMFEAVRARGIEDADIVAAVPLHWTRRLARGYNQADAIGRALAKRLKRPFLPRALKKTRPTIPQRGLARTERLLNLEGAFKCPRPRKVQGLRILLVDDVLTTAATADAAAAALRLAGAESVRLAVAARA